MTDFSLKPRSAQSDGNLPFATKTAVLSEHAPCNIMSIAPFKGQAMAVNDALKAHISLSLPKIGEIASTDTLQLRWVGQGVWFVLGDTLAEMPSTLHEYAAITDQSDAWCILDLCGEVQPVLARLTPLDWKSLGENQSAKTEFAKLSAMLRRIDRGVQIMVPRSAACWAVEQVKIAMQAVCTINVLPN